MSNLTALAKELEAKERAAAWKLYVELLEKFNGGTKDAEALLKAGRAVGRSAADIEREQAWLQSVRAQQKIVANGADLRDQEVALEQKVEEMEQAIQEEVQKLRVPQDKIKTQLVTLKDRSNAAIYAQQTLQKLQNDNLELADAIGMQRPRFGSQG